jgi:hypothetical protein
VGIFTDYAETMEKLYAAARRRSLKLMHSAGPGPDHEQADRYGIPVPVSLRMEEPCNSTAPRTTRAPGAWEFSAITLHR